MSEDTKPYKYQDKLQTSLFSRYRLHRVEQKVCDRSLPIGVLII